jgi:hypothetical protein
MRTEICSRVYKSQPHFRIPGQMKPIQNLTTFILKFALFYIVFYA